MNHPDCSANIRQGGGGVLQNLLENYKTMYSCIFFEGRALRQRSHKWRNDAVAVTEAESSSYN